MSLKPLTALVASASLTFAIPAAAQYMPHLDPNTYMLAIMNSGGQNTCITGSPPPESEIDEARLPAPKVVQAYFDAAQSGGAPSQAFRKSNKSQWSHKTVTVFLEQIDMQRDPLAVSGNRLDPEPLRFFRAGNFQTAHGQWSVIDGADSVVGVYDARFKRQTGEWKLQSLTVLDAGETVVPAMQYCMEPGDVTEHKIEAATSQIEHFEKQVAKSEGKLVRDEERLAKAEAKLAAKAGRVSYQESVRRAKLKVEQRKEKLAELREGLENAQESLMKSNRDAAEIAAMTLSTRDALRLRGFELTTDKEAAEKKAAEETKESAD